MLKGKLRAEKEVSDLVEIICLLVKEEFKNIHLEDHKSNNDLVLFIMSHVEEKFKDLSKKTKRAVVKNEIVCSIYQNLFGTELSEEDLNRVRESMEFIIANKLIKLSNWGIRKGVKFFCGLLG